MEDVLETYKVPYEKRFPAVCMDGSSKQLVEDVLALESLAPGHVCHLDHEYKRKGTCNFFIFSEPLRGWWHVWVTDQWRKVEYA
jgi:hypothetical protein